MKVLELRELSKRDLPIYYIREYTAVASLETPGGGRHDAAIAFTLEKKALGPTEISVQVLDHVDWPLLSVIKALRESVALLDQEGKLP